MTVPARKRDRISMWGMHSLIEGVGTPPPFIPNLTIYRTAIR
jgi:hypothetical protein